MSSFIVTRVQPAPVNEAPSRGSTEAAEAECEAMLQRERETEHWECVRQVCAGSAAPISGCAMHGFRLDALRYAASWAASSRGSGAAAQREQGVGQVCDCWCVGGGQELRPVLAWQSSAALETTTV